MFVGGTNLSHLVISCETMSSMAGNISRMAPVPKTGMSKRSATELINGRWDGPKDGHTGDPPILVFRIGPE